MTYPAFSIIYLMRMTNGWAQDAHEAARISSDPVPEA